MSRGLPNFLWRKHQIREIAAEVAASVSTKLDESVDPVYRHLALVLALRVLHVTTGATLLDLFLDEHLRLVHEEVSLSLPLRLTFSNRELRALGALHVFVVLFRHDHVGNAVANL